MLCLKAIHVAVAITMVLLLSTTNLATAQTKPGCTQSCGSVNIPFPFGNTEGCYLDESFLLNCNHSSDPPTLTFPGSNISILDISVSDGELRVAGPVSHDCYNELGNLTQNESETVTSMITFSNFSLSTTRNMFTAVGCDTVGVIAGSDRGRNYTTGCVALCNQMEDVRNGSCNGVGCCHMSIHDGVRDFATAIASLYNHSNVHGFNRCGYTFVTDVQAYNFSSLDLVDFQNRETVPVVLDWSVGNGTCEAAKENDARYACLAMSSNCVNSRNGGYRCTCASGFDGNPYLPDGCQDVNECESSNPCTDNATCENSVGGYSCLCEEGYEGDGNRDGTGCSPKEDPEDQTIKFIIPLGICVGLLVLLIVASWTYWVTKKRKLIRLREKFFQQNGGLLLQQQLAQYRGSVETAKVFTAEELNNATNNYEESRIIGQGGYGTVYKGMLTDNKLVAIKKSKIGDQSQIEQFINEVVVLTQINHRNVVKLIGCCLETEVPLLVYEFIANGNVSDYVHGKADHQYTSLSWEMRLKIARETASALAYLHSSTSMPIIHRDVKTSNILLDENYTAKVADFGASRLVPLDQTQLTTLVQGTFGYLDPEYFHTSQLTEKSDVYSFGVVLAELLTGEKALSFDRPESYRNLAMYFVSAMKQDRLLQILDNHMVADEKTIEKLKAVANVAKECLRVRGEERPTMKEIAAELEGLSIEMHPWDVDQNLKTEEAEYLIKPLTPYSDEDGHDASASNTTTGFDSMNNHHIIMPYDNGR